VGLGLGLGFPILICITISIIVFIAIKRQTKSKPHNRQAATVQGITLEQVNRAINVSQGFPTTLIPRATANQHAFRAENEAETINNILMHPERFSQLNLEQRLNEILDSTPSRATNPNITPRANANATNRNTDPEHLSNANPNPSRRSRQPRAREVTANDLSNPPPDYNDIYNE
jgi:hypothetical protein